MATQLLVSHLGFRQRPSKKFMQEAPYGERGNYDLPLSPRQPILEATNREKGSNPFFSRRPVPYYDQIKSRKSFDSGIHSGSGEKSKEGKIQRHGFGDEKQGIVQYRLGLWLLASSARRVAKKTRSVLYRWLICCNAFHHHRMEIEASLVDAHFSIPVVSATTVDPHVI
ncbi:hypothetical protein U1Q18_018930 [Sarracenia purpurea var. burkii]